MPSKNKPTTFNDSSLISSLSSIVQKQNVLAALLAEQKSKSTFKTKMRFAEMFQSVSYATQLIWRLRRVSRYLSQILHVEVLLLRITVRSFIRETALSHAQN